MYSLMGVLYKPIYYVVYNLMDEFLQAKTLFYIHSNGDVIIGLYVFTSVLFDGMISETHSADHDMYYTASQLITHTKLFREASACDSGHEDVRFES
jgi:hypothetical protein